MFKCNFGDEMILVNHSRFKNIKIIEWQKRKGSCKEQIENPKSEETGWLVWQIEGIRGKIEYQCTIYLCKCHANWGNLEDILQNLHKKYPSFDFKKERKIKLPFFPKDKTNC